ncbi:MAG TPA: TorF family putative porin [Burkholderiaceae bacterium]|nr:TorF family putative porin [Burkholderiaceae bacterium]
MKNAISAAVLAVALAGGVAQAEDVKPVHDLSFNVAAVSDYRYRGISQTRLEPALQGGADYTHNPTGFYAGTWLSTIKWVEDASGSGEVEWDLYGGKRGEIGQDIAYDVGVLSYVYPSNGLHPSANTTELYGQLGYGSAYIKYSHAVTDLFGFADSKNSGYLDIGANVELTAGLVLNLHVGRQTVKNNSAFSYTDWKAGLTRDFGVLTGSIVAVGTSTDHYMGPAPGAKNLGKTALVLSVSKTF